MIQTRFSLAPNFRAVPAFGNAAPQPLTTVTHEDNFRYNAPHHFVVKNAVTGDVISKVDFQEGPVKEVGLNGVQNEDLLQMVIARLQAFQNSAFACVENADALKKIQEALAILNARTAKRQSRGVEGTNQV